MRIVFLAGLALAAGLVAASFSPAQGASGATGNLVVGGTAAGDISRAAGETDTIGVDLTAGSKVNVRWSSAFAANVAFSGPGGPIALGLSNPKSATVSGWPVPTTGHYEFRISSADGTQGSYSLQVAPYWDKTVVLTGTDQQTFDVAMPASSSIKGKVQSVPGASNPSIVSFTSPTAAPLLAATVIGSLTTAKLPTISCTEAGTYKLTALATGGTKQFQATLKRKTPKLPTAKINIANGLDGVSFSKDGVQSTMQSRCGNCHDWAKSYSGVKAYATAALPRMKSGNMPQGGARIDKTFLTTFQQWISTGYGQ